MAREDEARSVRHHAEGFNRTALRPPSSLREGSLSSNSQHSRQEASADKMDGLVNELIWLSIMRRSRDVVGNFFSTAVMWGALRWQKARFELPMPKLYCRPRLRGSPPLDSPKSGDRRRRQQGANSPKIILVPIETFPMASAPYFSRVQREAFPTSQISRKVEPRNQNEYRFSKWDKLGGTSLWSAMQCERVNSRMPSRF